MSILATGGLFHQSKHLTLYPISGKAGEEVLDLLLTGDHRVETLDLSRIPYSPSLYGQGHGGKHQVAALGRAAALLLAWPQAGPIKTIVVDTSVEGPWGELTSWCKDQGGACHAGLSHQMAALRAEAKPTQQA